MTAEQAKKITDQAIADLAAALKAGKSDTLTRYLAMLGRFHRYSFGNVLLILCQRPDATRVAGFHAWRKLGRAVRKGEKGILIIAPMTIRPRQEADERSPTDDRPILRFRGVHVFDLAQTDGEPLPEFARVTGDADTHLSRLKDHVQALGIVLDHEDLPMGAEGVSRGGRISLRAGQEPAQAFSVLAHELAHEMLHRSPDRPASKTVRETEAEAVAFVVCSAVGLATGTAASDYIQLYDGTVETLTGSLDRIQKTASAIIEAFCPKPGDPVPKARPGRRAGLGF